MLHLKFNKIPKFYSKIVLGTCTNTLVVVCITILCLISCTIKIVNTASSEGPTPLFTAR